MIKNVNRSVMAAGNDGLIISLPVDWCKANGIAKGDTVRVTECPNGLLITKVEG